MSEMKDFIQIGDSYRITSDGKYNLILHEKYEIMEGRGKNAVPTGKYDYRWCGYYRSLEHIGNSLAEGEVFKYQGSELEDVVDRVNKIKEDIAVAMKSVNVSWAK